MIYLRNTKLKLKATKGTVLKISIGLSPIGSAVFELLSQKHTDIHTYRQTDIILL